MGDVNLKTRIALLALLLAPSLGFGQTLAELLAKSLTVHGPFDPVTYKPLSGQERWHRMVREGRRCSRSLRRALGIAAYKQTINSPSEWGRTPRGYLRRTGSQFSQQRHSELHRGGAWPRLPAPIPRYFACACSGLFPRTGHALKMTLLHLHP